jgi:putative membrane protein
MQRYRSFAVAAALAVAVGCGGGVDRAPDGQDQGGGGANGFGDNKQPTPAERTGATGDSGRGSVSLSDADRQFVQKASMSSQMEVALGNLAEDKAQSDQVKQFGEQLARDHEAANRELQTSLGGGDATTAQQPGAGTSVMTRPGGATGGGSATAAGSGTTGQRGDGTQGEHQMAAGTMGAMQQQMQQTQQRLERVTGREFDRAYLEEIIRHHQQDIQEFERAAQSDNPQVRAFAERTLPTLRQHLQHAEQLQQQTAQGQGNGPRGQGQGKRPQGTGRQ